MIAKLGVFAAYLLLALFIGVTALGFGLAAFYMVSAILEAW